MTEKIIEILAATIRQATPLLMIALGEIVAERAGVINIGLEGIAILGAFVGWITAFHVQTFSGAISPSIGILMSGVCGMFLAGLFAFLILRIKTDQVVTGTGINLLAFGFVELSYRKLFGQSGDRPRVVSFDEIDLPILSKIPILGDVLFSHNVLVYLTFVAVPIIYFFLFRTQHGLAIQACGEHPKAADTIGVKVIPTQAKCVIFGGFMAGVAGGYLSIADVDVFSPEMTDGRGFIALSIVIFGKWHPIKACGAALLFGFAEALAIKFQSFSSLNFIPYQFFLMLPYVMTLAVLAGFVGRSRSPAALAQPYHRE